MKDVSQWKLMWKKFRKISNLNKVWKILWIKWNNFEKHSKITRWFFIVFFFIGTTYLWYDRIIHTISKCTVSRNITHSKEFSWNQGKHQNFDRSILPYIGLILMGMKQKNSKWPTQINWVFQNRQSSKNFSRKFHRLVLGLVGLIDVKGIDLAQPIWTWGSAA